MPTQQFFQRSMPLHKAVISATGVYTPELSISNAELVEAFNAWASAENARNAPRIESGEMEAIGLSGTRLSRPTYHFGIGAGLTPAIDHILHGPGLQRVGEATVHKTRFKGAYPSDHYPISALYQFE